MLIRYFIVCLIAVFCVPLTGQQKDIRFRNYNLSDGLINTNVRTVFQDSEGYIWLGTQNGVCQFDGHNFKSFQNSENIPNSLVNNSISCFFEDDQQQLFIGTNRGLSIYNKINNSFTNFIYNTNDSTGLSNNYVWDIVKDKKGNIWIGTWHGLNKFDPQTNTFKTYFPNKDIYRSNIIQCLKVDHEDNLWIGTQNGIYTFKEEKFEHLPADKNCSTCIPHPIINTIYQDSKNRIWVGTKNGGFSLYMPESNSFKTWDNEPANPNTISSNDIRTICEDENKNLWIGTLLGLNIFNPEDESFSLYVNDFTNPTSLGQDAVWSVYKDKQNGMWVGTWAGGVDYYHPSSNNFSVYKHIRNNKNSLVHNEIRFLSIDENDVIWIATNKGINSYNTHSGKYNYYGKSNNLLLNDFCSSVAVDKNNNIWVGSKGVLSLINQQQNKITHYQHTESPDTSGIYRDFYYNTIYRIIPDNKNNLWVTANNEGLSYFNTQTKTFHYYRDSSHVFKFANASVNSIILDKDQSLWFFQKNDNTIYKFTPGLSLCTPVLKLNNESKIYTLFFDSNNQLWISTTEGILLYNPKNNTLKKIKGLENIEVHAIIEDNFGDFWLGANNNVIKYSHKLKRVKSYRNNKGIEKNDFTHESIIKTKTGEIFLGGLNGLISFHPESFSKSEVKTSITLTDFKLFNKTVPVNPSIANGFSLNKPISQLQKIKLKYYQNHIGFNFSALDYIYPNQLNYFYQLEGFDKDDTWTNAKNNSFAQYTNLDAGNYIFKVKEINGNSDINNLASIKIIITPPFWETWLFRIILAVLAITSIIIYSRMRERRLKLRQIILENQVKERTAKIEIQKEELATQAEELITTNEELQTLNDTKDKFFSIIAHDLRNPFQGIISFSEILTSDSKQLPQEKRKEILEIIKNTSKSTYDLLENLLLWARSHTNKVKFQPDFIEIKYVIEDTVNLLRLNADNKSIALKVQSEDKLVVYTDINMITTIVRNLLNNAIKFTPEKGEIKITAKRTDDFIEIAVKDTGVGMDESIINKLFKIDSQISKKGTSGEAGTGLGLLICKEFVDTNKGEIKVESEVGKGSTFIVKLPASDEEHIVEVQTNIAHNKIIPTQPQIIEESETPNLIEMDAQHHKTILLVEDNADIRLSISHGLENYFSIVETDNGKAGVEKAFEMMPDIIISDVMMPEMNGFELCEELKNDERTSHIPIILLTAKTSENSVIEGLGTGADIYLTKPFSIEILKAQIRNILLSRENLRLKFQKELVINPAEIAPSTADENFLIRALDIIEKNMSNVEFDVDHFVNEIGMSRTQLYRKIKSLTNQSVKEFIRNQRLKKAAILIKQGDLNITQITYEIGISNRSYFSKCFKEMFGVLPSEFK